MLPSFKTYLKTRNDGGNFFKAVLPDIIKTYESTHDRLFALIVRSRKGRDYGYKKGQDSLLRSASDVLDGFSSDYASALKQACFVAAKFSAMAAVLELKKAGLKPATSSKQHQQNARKIVEEHFKASPDYVSLQAQRMLAGVQAMHRKELAAISRLALQYGMNRRKAAETIASDTLANEPAWGFRDRLGRQWDNRRYFEMLAKTTISSIENEAFLQVLANEGHGLVEVSRCGANDDCKKWEGRVLSVFGDESGHQTVSDAEATGEIFHPWCRHRFHVHWE